MAKILASIQHSGRRGSVAPGGGAPRTKQWFGAAVCLVFALVLWAAVDTPAADAAPVDCNAAPDWIVSTEAELNAAIGCYNTATSPGAYTITLDQNIASSGSFVSGPNTASFPFILQSAPGYALTIDGADFTATGSGGAQIAVFGVAVGNVGSTVTFLDINVTGGDPAILVRSGKVTIVFSWLQVNTNGVGVDADATVIVTDSAITNSNGFGVFNRGKLTVYNSTISNNRGGGIYNVGSLIVSHSSLVSNGQAAIQTSQGAAILNSTIDGSWRGIDTYSGNTVISNSTVHAGIFPAVRVALGTTSIRSSIVGSCGPGITDLGNSLGGCFEGTPQLFAVGDNGCVTATPAGCVQTKALFERAEPTGMCQGVPVLDLATNTVAVGTLTTDQRGFPRTPAAAGCDVGAFEGDDPLVCLTEAGTMVVATEAELINAMDCFNRASAPGVHTIALASDITVTGSYQSAIPDPGSLSLLFLQSSTVPITQGNGGISLLIDGGGHTVTGSALHDVFFLLGPASPVTFANISVTGGAGAIVLTNADLRVRDSALTGNFVGIQGHFGFGASDIRVSNSLVANNTHGIRSEGANIAIPKPLLVTGSSIVNNFHGITTSVALLVVSNSTLDGNSTGILASGPAQAAVSNSTITGGQSVSFGGSGGVIFSSIVEQCSGAADGGRNAGGCFGTTAADLGPLVDNGCVTPTAAGCNPTRALLPGSAGSGTGICSGVLIVDPTTLQISTGNLTLDQRGMARTPVAIGCDAGAFEQ